MKTRLYVVASAAVLAAACSSNPPQNRALDDSRATYRAIAANPLVIGSAPVELARAEESLKRADTAWREGADPSTVNHLAYLAKQRALIAGERGELAQAQQKIEMASAERNRALLENRTRALAAEREAHRDTRQGQQQALERARAAETTAAQLKNELDELAARQTPIGMVMTLGDVLFDVGESTLKPGAERSLDRLAEFLKRHPERRVRVEGFTDSTGPEETNQELSRLRAQETREELTARGIAPNRVEAVGYGESFPIASNSTPAGRQQNRRVEIVISDGDGRVGER